MDSYIQGVGCAVSYAPVHLTANREVSGANEASRRAMRYQSLPNGIPLLPSPPEQGHGQQCYRTQQSARSSLAPPPGVQHTSALGQHWHRAQSTIYVAPPPLFGSPSASGREWRVRHTRYTTGPPPGFGLPSSYPHQRQPSTNQAPARLSWLSSQRYANFRGPVNHTRAFEQHRSIELSNTSSRHFAVYGCQTQPSGLSLENGTDRPRAYSSASLCPPPGLAIPSVSNQQKGSTNHSVPPQCIDEGSCIATLVEKKLKLAPGPKASQSIPNGPRHNITRAIADGAAPDMDFVSSHHATAAIFGAVEEHGTDEEVDGEEAIYGPGGPGRELLRGEDPFWRASQPRQLYTSGNWLRRSRDEDDAMETETNDGREQHEQQPKECSHCLLDRNPCAYCLRIKHRVHYRSRRNAAGQWKPTGVIGRAFIRRRSLDESSSDDDDGPSRSPSPCELRQRRITAKRTREADKLAKATKRLKNKGVED